LPYSSGCSNTRWDQHFPIPNGTTKCLNNVGPGCLFLGLTLWELNGLVFSPIANFFNKSPTWVGVCFTSSRCSFGYHANTFLFMCGSRGKRLVINLFYHTNIAGVVYNNSQHISKYCRSYCFREWSTCLKGGFLPFPSPHPITRGYPYYHKQLLDFDGRYHCWANLHKYGAMNINNNNTCNDDMFRKKHDHTPNKHQVMIAI
jgi:hypothetical protein